MGVEDLEVAQASIGPTSGANIITDNDPVTVWFQVENSGSDETGPFTVSFHFDDAPVLTSPVDNLPPGERQWVSTTVDQPLTAGKHSLDVYAHPAEGDPSASRNLRLLEFSVESMYETGQPSHDATGTGPLADNRVQARVHLELHDHLGGNLDGYQVSVVFNNNKDDAQWTAIVGGNGKLDGVWIDPAGTFYIWAAPYAGGPAAGSFMLEGNDEYVLPDNRVMLIRAEQQALTGTVKAGTREAAVEAVQTKLGVQGTLAKLVAVTAERTKGTTTSREHTAEETYEYLYMLPTLKAEAKPLGG